MTNKERLSICIVDVDGSAPLAESVAGALKICSHVIYLDRGQCEARKSEAAGLGADVAAFPAIAHCVGADWILFVKPTEVPEVRSEVALNETLANMTAEGYLVLTESDMAQKQLEGYQLISNLMQYENVGRHANITTAEPRLVRKSRASDCLEALLNGDPGKGGDYEEIAECLVIKVTMPQIDEKLCQEDPRERDRRCLQGKMYYGPCPADGIDELSSGFVGFRIVDEDIVDACGEMLRLGFHADKMVLPILRYLTENGKFVEAKELFDLLSENIKQAHSLTLQLTGASIYSNLFLIEKAMGLYQEAANAYEDSLAYANLGKLYLIDGNREKAIPYLKRSVELKAERFHEMILDIISKENWRSPRLSLCMIARDEEKSIGRALESVKGIADEIVLVDTGSSDRTVKIAEEYGAIVIENEWHDDFSAARNLAFRQAQGDYVLWLDADEYIDLRDKLGLALCKKLLPTDGSPIGFRIRIEEEKGLKSMSVSYLDRGMSTRSQIGHARLLPLRGGMRFDGAAFERIEPSLDGMGIDLRDNTMFKITHRVSQRDLRDKRKMAAIKKSLTSLTDPGTIVEGGLSLLKMGDLDTAYLWFEKLETVDPILLARISRLYGAQAQNGRAIVIGRKGLKNFPESAELRIALAEAYIREKAYDKAKDELCNRIESIRSSGDRVLAAEAAYLYGIALLETGRLAAGAAQIAYASEAVPLASKYKVAGLYALVLADHWEAVLGTAGRIINDEDMSLDIEIGDFADIGRLFIEMAKHFNTSGQPQAAEICYKILDWIVNGKLLSKDEAEKMEHILRVCLAEPPRSESVGVNPEEDFGVL